MKACLTFLLTLLANTCLNACSNPSSTLEGNGTLASIRVTALLHNNTLVELCLVNNVSSTVFRPESLKTLVQGSMLLVKYDSRLSSQLSGVTIIEDMGEASQKDPLKYLLPMVFFAAGLALLVSSIVGPGKSEEEFLKSIEKGSTPPKGSRLREETLLMLASRNPEAYSRVLEMVFKGELRVEKTGWLRSIMVKIIGFVRRRMR